jgi:uncharacterized membrane protein
MTLKKYQRIKLIIVFFLALIISQGLVLKNFMVPLASMVVASLVLFFLRRRVKEVVADERDYALAGKAAILAVQIFSWIGAILMFVFYGLQDYNPAYGPVGMTLAFAICGLMIIYTLVFYYYRKPRSLRSLWIYFLIVLVILVSFLIISARGLSGEDNWTCKNGQWIKHGQPSYPMPSAICQ